MSLSIVDSTVKASLMFGAQMLNLALETIKNKHANDHRVVDAVNAAEAAISGAVQGLLAL